MLFELGPLDPTHLDSLALTPSFASQIRIMRSVSYHELFHCLKLLLQRSTLSYLFPTTLSIAIPCTPLQITVLHKELIEVHLCKHEVLG